MSLHRLKETLLPCSSSSAFFQSQPGSPPLPPLPPRRPPKTSLSQQLLRLEASSSSFPAPPPSPPKPPSQLTAEDAAVKPSSSPPPSQEDEGPRLRRCPPPPPAAALESRGPYEPLVLSPPGERPIVQVPPSINCRLLAHQRDGVKFLYNLYRNNHGGMLGDDIMWLMDRHLYLPSRMADNCQQHICGTFPAMLSLIPLHFRYDWHIYVAVSIPKVEAAKRRLDAISLFLLY